jgi:hypothetical protein
MGNDIVRASNMHQKLGGTWSPSFLSPVAWFDASDPTTIVESGGFVSQWDDKSGNNNHATMLDGLRQPATGVNTIGGLNALDFDGFFDHMALTNPVDLIDKSVIVVLRKEANDFSTILGSNTDNPPYALWHSPATGVLECSGDPNPWLNDTGPSDPPNYGAVNMGTLIYYPPPREFMFGGDFGETLRGYVDGTAGSLPEARDTASPFVIQLLGGYRFEGAIYSTWEGPIGELIILDNPFDDHRLKLEGYLAHKWGMADKLPSDHPYRSLAP